MTKHIKTPIILNHPVAQRHTGNAGDTGLTPASGRFPGGGNGKPFQYSCLGKIPWTGSQRVLVGDGIKKIQT